MNTLPATRFALFGISLLVSCSIQTALGQLYWVGGADDGKWCTGLNWYGGSMPGGIDTGVFRGDDPDHTNVVVTCDNTLGRIRFANQGTVSRTISIGPDETADRVLTFSGVIVENISHENVYPGVNHVFSGATNAYGKRLKIQFVRTGTGTGPSKDVNVSSTDCSLTLSCDISGDQGIVKQGVGPLILSGANTYSGTNDIQHGSVVLGHPQGLGFGGLNLGPVDGGTLVRTFTTLDLGGQTNVNEVITLNGNGLGTRLGGALINSSSNAASIAAGTLASVTVVSNGAGYSSPPSVVFNGGGGSGAAATASLGLSGASIILSSGGAGYSSAPTVVFSGGGGSQAVAVATVAGGAVTGITITSPGHDYTSPPSISFSGGGGSGAAANVIGNSFVVVGATVTSAGTGYSAVPAVSLVGGGGAGAAATANLASVILQSDSLIGGSGAIDLGGIVSGIGALKKGSSGLLVLSGANAYTGPTIISNGVVLVNGSLAPASSVSVVGGTLAGRGLIGGPVTVSAGGSISAGFNTGNLILQGGLDLSAGGTNIWELAANTTTGPGTNYDQVVLTGGNLTLGGASTLRIRFTGAATPPDGGDPFWQAPHSWTIIAISGGTNAGPSNFAAIDNGTFGAGSFTTAPGAGGSIVLAFTPGASPPPRPRIISIVGAGSNLVTVTWTNVLAGTNYVLQVSTNLSATNWMSLAPITATNATAWQNDAPPVEGTRRFYRVVVP